MRRPANAMLVCAALSLFLAACRIDDVGIAVPSATPAPTHAINIDDELRNYELHVPETERPPSGWPLVVVFHGLGGSASQMRARTEFDDVADAGEFIVAYPDGLARAWLDAGLGDSFAATDIATKNLAFTSALIDEIDADHGIDPRRIYATGLSNGGMFSFHAACHLSERIAAVGLVASASISQSFNSCKPVEPVAYIAFHGTEDHIVPYDGGPVVPGVESLGAYQSAHEAAAFWVEINGCSATSVREDIPDTNQVDTSRAYRETWSPCESGRTVELVTLEDAGHTWPGRQTRSVTPGETNLDIDATQAIWDFFESHPKPAQP